MSDRVNKPAGVFVSNKIASQMNSSFEDKQFAMMAEIMQSRLGSAETIAILLAAAA
jgi:hypothetical protein